MKGSLFDSPDLIAATDQIYRYPLRQSAVDQLNRQLRSGISDQQLAELTVALYQDEWLCLVQEEAASREPQIICLMGLF